MAQSTRRHDIDWLRVIAIVLLIFYHEAVAFNVYPTRLSFIRNAEAIERIWVPMSMLNVWRIPLLFMVSGMGVFFAMRKRDIRELLLERAQRILLPFVFGTLVIVPAAYAMGSFYADTPFQYPWFWTAHLWFLGNLCVYIAVSLPLLYFMQRHSDGAFFAGLRRVMGIPFAPYLVALPLLAEAVVVNPASYISYAHSLHGLWLGLAAFIGGFCLCIVGESFWSHVLRFRWLYLVVAAGMWGARLVMHEEVGPNLWMAFESFNWLLAVFGFGFEHLNRPSAALAYLSTAAYPVYIVHQMVHNAAAVYVFPTTLAPVVKFVIMVAVVLAGSFAVYEFGIRRLNRLRALFGLKMRGREVGAQAGEVTLPAEG